MVNKLQIKQSFSSHLIPLVKIQELRIKAQHRVMQQNMLYDIPIEINGLGTLHSKFPELLNTPLTGYSTGDKYFLQRTKKLPKQFGLLHYGTKIAKRLVFQLSILTFTLNFFLFWSHFIQFICWFFVIGLIKVNNYSNYWKSVIWEEFHLWLQFNRKIFYSRILFYHLLDSIWCIWWFFELDIMENK